MAWWHESSVYQETVEEARLMEVRRLILTLGTDKFGTPDSSVVGALESDDNLERLERMHRSILRASNWQELIATDA